MSMRQRSLAVAFVVLSSCTPGTDLSAPPLPGPSRTPTEEVLACADAPKPPVAKLSSQFVPESRETNGVVSIPVTFGDGSRALIRAAETLGVHLMPARPDMSGGPEKEWIRPAVSYGGTPTKVDGPVDCVRGRNDRDIPVWEGKWLRRDLDELLYVRFGDWYVQVVERQAGLGYWARHLTGRQTKEGWLVFRGTGGLKMGPQREGSDSSVMFYDRDNILNVWVLRCDDSEEPHISMENGAFASFCSGDGMAEVHVQGNPRFVRRVVEGLTVTDVQPAYPLSRYAIVP